ncbi:hypothetical protein [Streptomyces flaveus]|uniref:Uncharacterized protein n=1 Tax=Streptomyces flaveus TaxID=66370 RepID=A0A917VT10_9ACTN|nr:hypothetical protein [Streptomyces flaveus]GGL11205.1 hypothetical protein GCM10010094_85090 [Streptomyces flaveus]
MSTHLKEDDGGPTMSNPKAGVYETPDDLLAEFFDDLADREEVKREAECLAAAERSAGSPRRAVHPVGDGLSS